MNKYDWGIFTSKGDYDYKDKESNIQKYINETLNKSLLMFRYKNLPPTIPQIELEKLLQINGYAGIVDVDGDIYALNGTLGGALDMYNRHTLLNVNNQYLNINKSYKIGEDCIIINNDYLGIGLIELYSRFAYMLVENDITMIRTNINKRIDNIMTVNDDNTGESANIYLDKVERGEIGYIMGSKLYDSIQLFNKSDKSGSNLNELFQYHQYLKGSLMNEIGLSANYNMKKERLITSEIIDNNDILYPLVDNMLECRKLALKEVNNKYGTSIEVELNSSWANRIQGNKGGDNEIKNNNEANEDAEILKGVINEPGRS